jgi:hypothetical protein
VTPDQNTKTESLVLVSACFNPASSAFRSGFLDSTVRLQIR